MSNTIDKDYKLTESFDKTYCMQVFSPMPVAFTHGKGSFLYSTEGKKYLDMIGGIAVNSLGHGNKALTDTIASQAKKLIHCSNYYYIPQRSELAYRLCSMSFADRCFIANSGAEANDGAIKLARGYFYRRGISRYKIITAKMSFHGRTLATLAATGQEKFHEPFEPSMPGFEYVEFNNIEALRNAVDGTTAAVMLELIQGESEVNPASSEYVTSVRKLCNDLGLLLIVDEIQTGIGRTGRMFCYERYGIRPDIMTLAKGLGGGVPIGAILATEEASKGFVTGDHGSTFGGNPLCCAAANTVLSEIVEKDILSNVNSIGSYITGKLESMKKKLPEIKEIRGMGLLLAIDFGDNFSASQLRRVLFDNGCLVSAIGSGTIRIAPPLILKKSEAQLFCKALESSVKALRASQNTASPVKPANTALKK